MSTHLLLLGLGAAVVLVVIVVVARHMRQKSLAQHAQQAVHQAVQQPVAPQTQQQMPQQPQQAASDYLGCFTDNASRVLPTQLTQRQDVSVDECKTMAASKGFQYYGLEYRQGSNGVGGQCFAGNAIPTAGAASNCGVGVGASAGKMLGGPWSLAVYKTA